MLGFHPLASRPFSDVEAATRLASLTVTEDDDTVFSALVLHPRAGGGKVRRRRQKPNLFYPEVETPPLAELRARLHVTEEDDTLAAFIALGEAPAARRRRQALNLLLMH